MLEISVSTIGKVSILQKSAFFSFILSDAMLTNNNHVIV